MAREEGHEALELRNGLVEGALAVVRLTHQEARARRVVRLRVALDDLLIVGARRRIVLLDHLRVAELVELLGGQERLGLLAEEVLDISAAVQRHGQGEQAWHRGTAERAELAWRKGNAYQRAMFQLGHSFTGILSQSQGR